MTEKDFFERVVQEVIRRLREMQGEDAATAETSPQSKTINDRLVTLSTLGQLSGIKKLIVRRDAIVTPSVKDELRDKNIELERT